MTQLTYEDFQQRGQAVIDAAMPLREEAIQLEKQVAAEHLAATFARDAQMKAHWAIRDAQDAKHMASAKFLLTAESRLAAAEATLDKAREAIGLADGADAITESTPDIPEKYVRAFISERAIMFDEADAPIAAYLTRTARNLSSMTPGQSTSASTG